MDTSRQAKLKLTKSRVFKSEIPYEIITLEDKINGDEYDFNIYDDCDVPFLNDKTEMGKVIRKTIIDGDIDDDCATDNEQKEDAKEMMRKELLGAITKYQQEKKDGTVECYIKNLNNKRFNHQ